MLEAQSNVVETKHTALGQLKVPKKKELLLAALTMSQNEFANLSAEREKLIVESLIVDLSKNITVDTVKNEGQVMGDEVGV
jgi:hypothetical protein